MQSRQVTQDFFINPGVDLQKGNADYNLAAKLSKQQLKNRWKTTSGQDILSRLSKVLALIGL